MNYNFSDIIFHLVGQLNCLLFCLDFGVALDLGYCVEIINGFLWLYERCTFEPNPNVNNAEMTRIFISAQ